MLYPMMMMFLLTFIIGVITVTARFKSVKNGLVKAKYFKLMDGKLMDGEQAPEFVVKTTRCFNNQFEVPVLFYVVSTLYIALGVETIAGILLAWSFVVFRIVHAYIHLTYNHIFHRMLIFWLAFVAVMALWLILVAGQL